MPFGRGIMERLDELLGRVMAAAMKKGTLEALAACGPSEQRRLGVWAGRALERLDSLAPHYMPPAERIFDPAVLEAMLQSGGEGKMLSRIAAAAEGEGIPPEDLPVRRECAELAVKIGALKARLRGDAGRTWELAARYRHIRGEDRPESFAEFVEQVDAGDGWLRERLGPLLKAKGLVRKLFFLFAAVAVLVLLRRFLGYAG